MKIINHNSFRLWLLFDFKMAITKIDTWPVCWILRLFRWFLLWFLTFLDLIWCQTCSSSFGWCFHVVSTSFSRDIANFSKSQFFHIIRGMSWLRFLKTPIPICHLSFFWYIITNTVFSYILILKKRYIINNGTFE